MSNYRARLRIRRDDEGFVLLTALMVIFLVVAIVSTVAIVTAQDMQSSARARAIIKTRFVAESVSDSIFARIAGLKNGFILEAKKFRVDETNAENPSTNPSVFYNSVNDPNLYGDNWFALDDNGKLKTCDNAQEICFRGKIRQISTAPLVNVNARDEISLDLVVRGGCYGDDVDNLRNCIFREFQTRYRTRSYIDTVSIANTERSSLPGIPADPDDSTKPIGVALLPSDDVSGAIQTNDPDGYIYCGPITSIPEIRSLIGGQGVRNLQDDLPPSNSSCAAGSSVPVPNPVKEELLPGQITTTGETNSTSVFIALAGSSYNFPSSISLTLNSGNITVGTNTIPYPPNGVIYVDGTVTIQPSTYSRSLTIYATAGVVINGDVIPAPTGNDAFLGIATSSDIVLSCNPGLRCPDRTIKAVLNAGGKIYNNSWSSSPVAPLPLPSPIPAAPTFTLVGALVSRERPVFGSYTTDSNAQIVSGWRKNLTFDIRLLDGQPPFFFRTTQASVVRSSMDEDRCTESFCT